ncbi:hypothetical protein EVA_15402 [gut metagenome]|uniref:Uncharacterized protein n=1 Tax=gut metagenome TaxID=749906 RepID=J9FPU5_9ZZZZ
MCLSTTFFYLFFCKFFRTSVFVFSDALYLIITPFQCQALF